MLFKKYSFLHSFATLVTYLRTNNSIEPDIQARHNEEEKTRKDFLLFLIIKITKINGIINC